MRARRSVRALVAAAGPATLIAFLLTLPAGPSPIAGPPGATPASPLHALSGGAGGCPGPAGPLSYQGRVADTGGGAGAPALGNQSVYVDYRYTQTFRPTGGGSSAVSCVSTAQSTLTAPNGSFTVPAPLPPPGCARPLGCLSYSGPYGPVAVGLRNGSLPAGYFLNETGGPTNLTLDRVYALASVGLDPSGFPTVSTDASVPVTATPWAADGSRSPATVGYAWDLKGSGWAIVGSATNAAIVVRAIPGAGLGTLTAWVNGSFGGASIHAAPVDTVLTAVATQITGGGVSPSSVDAGTPVTFTIDGSGAMGYAYTATVRPAAGLAPVDAPCTPGSIASGVQLVSCTVAYRYPGRMTAQPEANLSNGDSSANTSFGTVNVSLGLAVAVDPNPAIAYAGVPLAIRANVAAGTGTPPYGPACFADGQGNLSCDRAPGSAWAFAPRYASAGQYGATLSVADGGGTNDSTPISVTIVDPPALAPLALASSAVLVGNPLRAASALSGGAFPVLLWWNSSDGSSIGPIVATADGVISVNVSGGIAGVHTLTLSALDALGGRRSVAVPYTVDSTAASAIALDRSAAPSVTAGSPVTLSFEAEDALAGRVPSYRAQFTLWPSPAVGGGAWANISGGGPADQIGDAFVFPPSAWQDGYLNLTFTDGHTGAIELTFPGGDGVLGPAPVPITVTPDAWHEALHPTEVLRAGARSNATLYELSDRFGNAVPFGQLELRSVFGANVAVSFAPILEVDGGSFAWVNYTSPTASAGTIYVLGGPASAVLLTIDVPAAAAAPLAPATIALSSGLAAIVAAALVVVALGRRRRRLAPPSEAPLPEDPDNELGLRRLADGRTHVLARVPFDRSVDLAFIVEGFPGEPPDAAELAEWVASLVREGLLVPSIGAQGRPEFRQQAPPKARPPPRVEIDPLALDAALARQRLDDEAADDPPDAPP